MKILINHIGYEINKPKKAIIEAKKESSLTDFSIINSETRELEYQGKIEYSGKVDNWRDWEFWSLDFSDFNKSGKYYIKLNNNEHSHLFEINEDLVKGDVFPGLMYFLKSQRSSGKWDRHDYNASFVGSRKDTVDVHGGWYDASGDKSKYLSHLSYANFMNPQQTPLVVWNLLTSIELMKKSKNDMLQYIEKMIIEEAFHGADFLYRMNDEEGYFYTIIFDKWSGDPEKREICTFSTSAGNKSDDYKSGYRQGAGLAIAALAKISKLKSEGEYKAEDYLNTAIKAFKHLEENNLNYLDDGKENIIDDYCALLAATELFDATKKAEFMDAANKRASSLMARMISDDKYKNWWSADENKERPYFHAADAGLPIVSLLRYSDVVKDKKIRKEVLEVVKNAYIFELSITDEVNNPFGYARQYIKPLNGDKRTSFFFPHENESGYWWQGENARLASIATASRLAKIYFKNEKELINKLEKHAINQLDWILGLNPFDICFVQSKGRNNPEFFPGYYNAPCGICNGITSGFNDESDIDFLPDEFDRSFSHKWRWSEQWICHASWFIIAIASL